MLWRSSTELLPQRTRWRFLLWHLRLSTERGASDVCRERVTFATTTPICGSENYYAKQHSSVFSDGLCRDALTEWNRSRSPVGNVFGTFLLGRQPRRSAPNVLGGNLRVENMASVSLLTIKVLSTQILISPLLPLSLWRKLSRCERTKG